MTNELKPTQSKALYMQTIGRAKRPTALSHDELSALVEWCVRTGFVAGTMNNGSPRKEIKSIMTDLRIAKQQGRNLPMHILAGAI